MTVLKRALSKSRSASASPLRFGIVAGRFNRPITERLVQGALGFLRERGLPGSRVSVVWVPGAFELPLAALALARSGRYRAIIAVGCILQGETPQYRYLAQAAFQGLMTASLLTGVPITSGVVVAGSTRQALERSRGKRLHRGREAAQAAWEMTHTLEASRQGCARACDRLGNPLHPPAPRFPRRRGEPGGTLGSPWGVRRRRTTAAREMAHGSR